MQDSGKVKKCSFCWKRTITTQEYSCCWRACKHLWDTVSIRIWSLCIVSKHDLCSCWSQQVLTANTKACRNLLWFREAKFLPGVLPVEQQKKWWWNKSVSLETVGWWECSILEVTAVQQHTDMRLLSEAHMEEPLLQRLRCECVLFQFLQVNKKQI